MEEIPEEDGINRKTHTTYMNFKKVCPRV